MKRLAILIVACLIAIGCAKSHDLNGLWNVDIEKTAPLLKESEAYKTAPERLKKDAEEGMRKVLTETSFNFAQGKMTIKMQNTNRDVDVKILSSSGNEWQLETAQQGQKPQNISITWTDEDHVAMHRAGEKATETIYLVRAKPTK